MEAAATDNAHQLVPVNTLLKIMVVGHVSPSTLWRWIVKGVGGTDGTRIRLKVWYVGRTPHTTRAAVVEWLTAVTEARLQRSTAGESADVSHDELRAAGLIDDGKVRNTNRGVRP